MAETRKIEISVKELNEIIKIYHMLSDFLDNFVDRIILYKEKFIEGLDFALEEVLNKQTKPVRNFDDFVL